MEYRRSDAKKACRELARGIWVTIVTPFNDDGSLDENGLRRNVRYLTDDLHVHGIMCAGFIGEFFSLTKDEWKRLIKIVCEEARGKTRVIAGTGHHSAAETIELTRFATEVGADFAVVSAPYYPNKLSDTSKYEWLRYVADRVDIGLWIFSTVLSGYLPAEMVARLADIENVCGFKCNGPDVKILRDIAGDKVVVGTPQPNFMADFKEYKQHLLFGAAVGYLFQTPEYPRIRECWELCEKGKYDEAERVDAQLAPMRALAEKYLGLGRDGYNHNTIIEDHAGRVKAWSEIMGMAGGPVRLPCKALQQSEKDQLRSALIETGLVKR